MLCHHMASCTAICEVLLCWFRLDSGLSMTVTESVRGSVVEIVHARVIVMEAVAGAVSVAYHLQALLSRTGTLTI